MCHARCPLNSIGPGPSRLRLRHSRSLCPPRHGLHVQCSERTPCHPCQPISTLEARGVRSGGSARDRMWLALVKTRSQLRGAPSWSFVSWPWNGLGLRRKPRSVAGASSPLATRRLHRGYPLADHAPYPCHRWRARKKCPKPPLSLAKVGHGIPSWLMAAPTALARDRALVKSMVAARSVPSVVLHWCSSVSWVSRAACSLMSSSSCCATCSSASICRARIHACCSSR
jgi:hypothetical protein